MRGYIHRKRNEKKKGNGGTSWEPNPDWRIKIANSCSRVAGINSWKSSGGRAEGKLMEGRKESMNRNEKHLP